MTYCICDVIGCDKIANKYIRIGNKNALMNLDSDTYDLCVYHYNVISKMFKGETDDNDRATGVGQGDN